MRPRTLAVASRGLVSSWRRIADRGLGWPWEIAAGLAAGLLLSAVVVVERPWLWIAIPLVGAGTAWLAWIPAGRLRPELPLGSSRTSELGAGDTELVLVEAATFWMGSQAEDPDGPNFDPQGYPDLESPPREVMLSAYGIARLLVTRDLWRDTLREAQWVARFDRLDLDALQAVPWLRHPYDGRLPATSVSWYQAVAFSNVLSRLRGLEPCYAVDHDQVSWVEDADGYRLPTEAEWEHACRGRTTTPWYWGDDPDSATHHAWFDERASKFTAQPVGQKRANTLGLHDMAGNAWEWCWDRGASVTRAHPYRSDLAQDPRGEDWGDARVLRGGSTRSSCRDLRSSVRSADLPDTRYEATGFRLVRSFRRPRG